MKLLMKVIKPFGYYDNHTEGEKVHIPLKDVNMLIKGGYAEIIVNSDGYNEDREYQEPVVYQQPPAVSSVELPTPPIARGPRDRFWCRYTGACLDCGGNVNYNNALNTIYCDTCDNEIPEWM